MDAGERVKSGGYTKRRMRQDQVLAILKTARPQGLTAQQIAARNGASKAVIQRALRDLKEAGYVRRLGGQKRDGGELWAVNDA
jgi:DNA-binding IscR family transcriptional regulator